MISKRELIKKFIYDLRLMISMVNSSNSDEDLKKGLSYNIYYEICTMYSLGLISLDKRFYLQKIIFI